MLPVIEPMAKAYLELYDAAAENREFYGLRDFYRFDSNRRSFKGRFGEMKCSL